MSWRAFSVTCYWICILPFAGKVAEIWLRPPSVFRFSSLLQWLLNCSEFCHMATHQAVGSKRLAVGAHYGLFSWLMQRITAVVMAAYTVILLICFFSARRFSHAGWVALFEN